MLRILLFLLSSSPFLLFGNTFRKSFAEFASAKVLQYGYNDEGQLVAVLSEDGSAGYDYFYDTFGRVTQSINRKTGEQIKRIYDKYGNLLEEAFPGGFSLKNSYDDQGKRIATTLPDQSSIEYIYFQSHLQKVIRKSKMGETLYTHTYAAYDDVGHATEQEMIGNVGTISSLFDEKGRNVRISTPCGIEEIQEFDTQGNILKMHRHSGASTFFYDEKNELIQENNHSFTFDDHGEYDDRGNTVRKDGMELAYDAFDRLISIEKPETFYQFYTYDGFHRRLTETVYLWENNRWHKKHIRYFLYDCQNEIGAFDEEGKLVELRILGRTQNADIGAAVALELDGKVFAPVHDLTGNITALISLETRSVAQTYAYHAFGEEDLSENDPLSPWRFCSKRCDPLTGLVFFGRRYYDPQVRRWLTKDPNHPADGANPYTFVHNNPLIFIDLYGLESIVSQIASWVGTIIQQYCYHVIPFPGIRYLGIYFGELLGATPIPDTDYECFSGSVGTVQPEKNHVNVWINGLNTNLQSTIHFAKVISEACGGEKVHFAYNSTKGLMADLWEHIAGKLYFQTSAVFVAITTLQQAIKEVGGPNNGGRVTVFAHSQGGYILSRAINLLSIEEQKMLQVYTFGTASLFSQSNLAEVRHYISDRDYVPLVADPLRYLLAYIWGSSIVHFIPSNEGNTFENHAIQGSLYQNEILQIGAQIQEHN